jgi:hypothetical protein
VLGPGVDLLTQHWILAFPGQTPLFGSRLPVQADLFMQVPDLPLCVQLPPVAGLAGRGTDGGGVFGRGGAGVDVCTTQHWILEFPGHLPGCGVSPLFLHVLTLMHVPDLPLL